MTPEDHVALITVLGTLGGALIGLAGTWLILRAERQRVRIQLDLEASHRRSEKRRDELVTLLSELLAATDPEIHGRPEYPKVVRLIHHVQLILEVANPPEAALNTALSELGHAAAAHYTGPSTPGPQRDANARELLAAQSHVTEFARATFRLSSGAA